MQNAYKVELITALDVDRAEPDAVASAADVADVATALLAHLRTLAKAESCKTFRVWTLGRDDWSRHLASESVEPRQRNESPAGYA